MTTITTTDVTNGTLTDASVMNANFGAIKTVVNRQHRQRQHLRERGDRAQQVGAVGCEHRPGDDLVGVGLAPDDLPSAAPLDYVQITSNVTISGSTYSSPTNVITGSTLTYAATPTLIEFYSPRIERTTGVDVNVALYDGSTHICTLAYYSDGNGGHGVPCYVAYRFTPTASSHTYNIKAFSSGGNTTRFAGAAGGSGAYAPSFIRVTLDG